MTTEKLDSILRRLDNFKPQSPPAAHGDIAALLSIIRDLTLAVLDAWLEPEPEPEQAPARTVAQERIPSRRRRTKKK